MARFCSYKSYRYWCIALALAVSPAYLHAQEETGKIQGYLVDVNAMPIGGATVDIVALGFSAKTNEDGFYFLNGVPAGTYTVRARQVGYQPAEIRGILVRGGQTIDIPFRLGGAVQLEAIRVTVASAPLVPRDQVSSRSTISGDEVDALPVSDPDDIVLLQPGVVVSRPARTEGNSDDAANISIRGGRPTETAVFIDGAPVRSNRLAGTNLDLATNAVAEISVTTGALGSEFGNVQSGVISFVTRSGGPSLDGSFSYETDGVLDRARSTGLNRFEASLGGPVAGNLTFFVAGTAQERSGNRLQSGAENIPLYVLGGVDTTFTERRQAFTIDEVTGERIYTGLRRDAEVVVPAFVQYSGRCSATANQDASGGARECVGLRRPNSWTTNGRLSGKLQYTFGGASRIAVSAHLDRDQAFGSDPLMTESARGQTVESGLYVLNWNQQLRRTATSDLAVNLNLSYQRDRVTAGLVDRSWDLAHRSPRPGLVLQSIDYFIDRDHFSEDTGPGAVNTLNSEADWDQLVLNTRLNRDTRRPMLGRFDLNPFGISRLNPYGVANPGRFNTGGYSFDYLGSNYGVQLSDEERFTGRANIDWQAGRFNRIKFGGEYRSAQTRHFFADMVDLVGSGQFGDIYTGNPIYASVFAQDRLDLGDVVIELGLRWDFFDSKALLPRIPGRIADHPDFDENNPTSDLVFRRAESHTALSPRVRVGFPLSERTAFRMSYAHQVQAPRFHEIYNGANNGTGGNGGDRYGGDLDFARTIQFEFGIRHAFSSDLVLDLTAYNKDKRSDFAWRIATIFDPVSGRLVSRNIATNADFGNVRGFELSLIGRISNLLHAQISYTNQNSRSTGSDPSDYLFGLSRQPAGVLGGRPDPPQTTQRTRDDRRHNLVGSFSLSFPESHLVSVLRGLGVFGTFRVSSGLPYTRHRNRGVGRRSDFRSVDLAETLEQLNSSETPWVRFFDLRVTKGLRLGGLAWTLYADVRNLFNFSNELSVFSETGSTENEQYFRTRFLDAQVFILMNQASDAGFQTTVTRGSKTIDAVDLNNNCMAWAGNGSPIGCFLLRGAEQRFGNGDGIYDMEEHERAVRAWYEATEGSWTFLGNGRQIRLGAQIDF